jgi:hypothetical protein
VASTAEAQHQDAPNELQAVDYALLPAGAALVRHEREWQDGLAAGALPHALREVSFLSAASPGKAESSLKSAMRRGLGIRESGDPCGSDQYFAARLLV